MARSVGVPLTVFLNHIGPLERDTQALLSRMVERAALTYAIDDAWAIVATVTLLAIVAIAVVRKPVLTFRKWSSIR